MSRRRGAGWAAFGVLLLLAGCGGSGSTTDGAGGSGGPSPAATTAPPAPEPTRAPAPSGDPQALESAAAVAELAVRAQEAAGRLNAQVEAGTEPRDGPVLGADISWPQCPPGMGMEHKVSSGQPMPTAEAEYVVIGLTNGPGGNANPCLADQVAWAAERELLVAAYSVIYWPDAAAREEAGGLQEAGYAQARFNVEAMRSAGMDSPVIWLDVEQVPHYEWSTDVVANAEVVVGAARGYLDAGYRIGVYSTPYIWESLVGDLTLGAPEWRAAGQTSRAQAESRCGPDWSIQGGEAVLAQWVQDDRDKNVTCPGAERRLGEFFSPL